MKRRFRVCGLSALAFGLLLALGGCASNGVDEALPDGGVDVGDARVFETLPAQSPRIGACPLVLWSREAQSRRLAVATTEPAAARIQIDGKTKILSRTRQSGAAAFGHWETEVYSDGGDFKLTIVSRFSDAMPDANGTAIRSASLDLRVGALGSVVIPVVGLVACGPGQ